MAEKVTLEILTKLAGSTGSSGSGSTSSSSKGGGIFGAVKSIAGIGLGVAGVLSLLKDMFWSLKPLLTVISSIAKMLGMFLQPIAEVLMLLLVPILTLLRPIVQAFNIMLAPFMDLIRQAGILANLQAEAGDTSGLIQTASFMMQAIMQPIGYIIADTMNQVLFGRSSIFSDDSASFLASAVNSFMTLVGGDAVGTIFEMTVATLTGDQLALQLAVTDLAENGINNPISNTLTNLNATLTTKLDTIEENFKEFGGGLSQAMDDEIIPPFTQLIKKLGDIAGGRTAIRDTDYWSGTTAYNSVNNMSYPNDLLSELTGGLLHSPSLLNPI